jgi:hypothetical protein
LNSGFQTISIYARENIGILKYKALEFANSIRLFVSYSPMSRLTEPGPAGDTVQPPPCRQRSTQPIGGDIAHLRGPLRHAGLVEFIGDALAERGQDAVESDLP